MKIRNTIFLAIFFMIITTSTFAGVWKDDFGDGKDDGWNVVSGEWEVQGGVYEQTIMDAVYQKSILNLENLKDFTIEMDVTILENSAASTSIAAGMLVRTDPDGSSGYRIWVRPDVSGFQFSVWQNNAFVHVITDAATKSINGEINHLKVEIQGFKISAWVDDKNMVDEYEDTSKLFASGHIGLINYNAHCQYDNIVISGTDVPSNTAVATIGKIASLWGTVKNLNLR